MANLQSAIPLDELESLLRRHVGDKVYERGAGVFGAGKVGALRVNGDRVRATVTGSEPYRVEVRRTPRGYEGECSCPASDGFDFCKHCIAVALAVENQNARREQAAAGEPLDRVRHYLEQLPREELVTLIADAAKQTPELQARLQLRSDAATGALDLRALRKIVTAGMPLRHVWQRAKVRAYFAKAVSAMCNLLDVAEVVSPEDLLTVSVHAIDRLNAILERVDDSDGNRWFVQDRVRTLHAIALRRLDGTPDERAQLLLSQVLRDPYDLFDDSIDDYDSALGEAGTAAFFAQARVRLDELLASDDNARAQVSTLSRILARRAEAIGDIDTLITLTEQQCSGAFDHYRLAELYLQKPDLDAALAALNKGDVIANEFNRNDELRVAIHSARAEWSEAADAQLNALRKQPSIERYQALLDLADRTGERTQARRRGRMALASQLDAGHAGRNDSARVLALLAHEDGDLDEAFELIVSHVSDPEQLLSMMAWYTDEQPARAAQLFECVIEATIARKKNGAYREAVSLIKTHRPLFDSLGPRMFGAFIGDLRERHRAKRNLMMLLDPFV